MVQMEESMGLPRNDITLQAGALAENAVNKKIAEIVTENRLGKYEREVDEFERVPAGGKTGIRKYRTVISERSDADDSYLEEKRSGRRQKVTKTSLHGYILHMEETRKGGYHHFTDDGGDEAFLIMNVCEHASGGTRRKICMRRKWRKSAGGLVSIRYQRFWHNHPGRRRRRLRQRAMLAAAMRPESVSRLIGIRWKISI